MRPLRESAKHGDFNKLPEEQRERMMKAAIEGFGRNSYKEASTEDIARKANISKGLLFFYFRNKSTLYKRTMEFLMERTVDYIVDEQYYAIDDFFDVLLYAGEQKLASLARWPWAFEFSVRAFYPDHRDIRDDMNRWNDEQMDIMYERFMGHVDFSRFRDEVSPREVLDMLIMLGDGYLHKRLSSKERIDLAAFLEEYRKWCAILKGWAYKPEFL
ncbi:MAG: TetR/AcrR family transcriptional regulator [Eggerthellaceae bacterium]|nr:TetR/AcrR family transcriptional regulator [Eggerthellaceae bacterium]